MSELLQRATELPWGYIFSTLIIRFVGVFIVLAILMVAMQILGAVVSRLVTSQESRRAKELEREREPISLAESPELESREEELAAAIGAALAFSMEPAPYMQGMQATPQEIVANGTWALAGRMALMDRRLPAGTQQRTT